VNICFFKMEMRNSSNFKLLNVLFLL